MDLEHMYGIRKDVIICFIFKDFWHSSSATYNNQYNSKLFGAGDKISVTYTSTNTSIQFYQN